jgi:hypothetical protein
MRDGTVYGSGADTGLKNTATTGAALALGGTSVLAKYGDGSNIIASGLATNETLVGHE